MVPFCSVAPMHVESDAVGHSNLAESVDLAECLEIPLDNLGMSVHAEQQVLTTAIDVVRIHAGGTAVPHTELLTVGSEGVHQPLVAVLVEDLTEDALGLFLSFLLAAHAGLEPETEEIDGEREPILLVGISKGPVDLFHDSIHEAVHHTDSEGLVLHLLHELLDAIVDFHLANPFLLAMYCF